MIDWDAPDPKPDFVPPQGVELRTLDDALKLIDAWEEAYNELNRAYVRLHSDYIELKAWAESERTIAESYGLLYKAAIEG